MKLPHILRTIATTGVVVAFVAGVFALAVMHGSEDTKALTGAGSDGDHDRCYECGQAYVHNCKWSV